MFIPTIVMKLGLKCYKMLSTGFITLEGNSIKQIKSICGKIVNLITEPSWEILCSMEQILETTVK